MQHNSHTACNLLSQCLTVYQVCLLQTTSLQIIANAINIKSSLFVIYNKKLVEATQLELFANFMQQKKKGLEYISFSEWLTVPLL